MAETTDVLIRDPDTGDEAAWRRLWSGYTAFYHADVPEAVTALTWSRILDPDFPMFGRIAERNGAVEGFTVSILHPSTWTEALNCYLEDLYVDESARGQGIGGALIDDLLALARNKGWARLYWHTESGNTTARTLYDRYTKADGFVRYRVPLSDYTERGNSGDETIV